MLLFLISAAIASTQPSARYVLGPVLRRLHMYVHQLFFRGAVGDRDSESNCLQDIGV